jgi:hypothetical protein
LLGCKERAVASTAIPDIITVVGTSYLQPVADLIDRLLSKPAPGEYAAGTSSRENGYSAAITVLLVAVLESFVSRLRFLRNSEITSGKDVPEQLQIFFPDLPNKEDLAEVFLLRNIVVHNHVWHLDVSDVEMNGASTLANPKDLRFQTKASYDTIVDLATRKTRRLGLNANPIAVDRRDAGVVFRVIWDTLLFMNAKSFSHTPLAGQTVKFRGKFEQFGELRELFPDARSPSIPI